MFYDSDSTKINHMFLVSLPENSASNIKGALYYVTAIPYSLHDSSVEFQQAVL